MDKPDLFAPPSETRTLREGEHIQRGWSHAKPLPDSGSRTQFDTGAVRDAQPGKGHFMDIPPIALQKLARRFEDGAVKYGRLNWQKGIPLSSFQNSLTRHTLAAAAGLTDEDHLGAILWNAAVWAWTEQEIEAGRLPKSLDDLPFRRRVLGTLEALTNDPSFCSP